MRRYVRLAASMDVVVVWCLWNGAVLRDARTLDMIMEPSGDLHGAVRLLCA